MSLCDDRLLSRCGRSLEMWWRLYWRPTLSLMCRRLFHHLWLRSSFRRLT